MSDVRNQVPGTRMNDEQAIRSFEDLEVFKRAYRVSLDIHRVSLAFPKIEQYALADQVRRASKSICANLAEGFAKQRRSPAEYRRFLQMVYCAKVMRQAAASFMRPSPWLAAGRP